MNKIRKLTELYIQETKQQLKLGSDTFILNIHNMNSPKGRKILQQIERDYPKYKKKVLDYLKGISDQNDLAFQKVDGVKGIEPDMINVDTMMNPPNVEVYWKLKPYGVVTNKKGKKFKISYIGIELQDNNKSIVPYVALPREFYL